MIYNQLATITTYLNICIRKSFNTMILNHREKLKDNSLASNKAIYRQIQWLGNIFEGEKKNNKNFSNVVVRDLRLSAAQSPSHLNTRHKENTHI